MKVLIITGAAASGKNTTASVLAHKFSKCAVIDVDALRWLYANPHKAPWEGEEGKLQQKIGVENACILARNFAKHGVEIIILDVLIDETAQLYRANFPEAKIIKLMPTFEEAHNRFSKRSPTITEEEFGLVYSWQKALTVYDEKIDNTNISAEEAAQRLYKLLLCDI